MNNDTSGQFAGITEDLPPSYDAACQQPGTFAAPAPPSAVGIPPQVPQPIVLGSGISVIDFLPDTSHARFPSLIQKANTWLSEHREWVVKTCETIPFTSNAGRPEATRVTFANNAFVHCLRLWLIPQLNPNLPPATIAYFNVEPKCLKIRKPLPLFEDLKDLLAKLNSHITTNPLPGRIVTVESLHAVYNPAKNVDDSIDADKLLFAEGSNHVLFLRIFYLAGPCMFEVVGITDFFPKVRIDLAPAQHEPFPDLVQQVAEWLGGVPCQICNMQTIANVVEGYQNRMTLSMRVVTLRPLPGYEKMPRPYSYNITGPLMTKTFLPIQLTKKDHFRNWNEPPQFESVQQTLQRICHWAKERGVKLIAAETRAFQMYPETSFSNGPQSTDLVHSQDKTFIWIVRLYVDGLYTDPPLPMCPIAYRGWMAEPVREGAPVPPSLDEAKGECVVS